MTKIYHTERSRDEAFARCPRAGWLGYYDGPRGADGSEPRGIQNVRKALPLAVGGAVHAGLAMLLGVACYADQPEWASNEDRAVRAALDDFARYAGKLDIATGGEDAKLDLANDYQEYLYGEQAALVEALVRVWARRRLPRLLEAYEVLEVEREGEWLLAKWTDDEDVVRVRCKTCTYVGPKVDPDYVGSQSVECPQCHHTAHYYGGGEDYEVRFMSRLDALLRDRKTNELLIQSFKTGASWDFRKERDALRDLQGISEAVDVEKRLGLAWKAFQSDLAKDRPEVCVGIAEAYKLNTSTTNFLLSLGATPRIAAIRYEYLLKGERREDKDLSARFGMTARTQRSHLIRPYLNAGMVAGDEQWCWSWGYLASDGSGERKKLNYRQWDGAAVWQHMRVVDWIDKLDATEERFRDSLVLDEGLGAPVAVPMGYAGPAQALGYTEEHPFDAVLPPPMIVYRNEDDARDWFEQTEAAARRRVEDIEYVRAAGDAGERRSRLNERFPQNRRSCEYPTTCQFVAICWGGDDIRRDPVGSGLYKVREINHPQELSAGDRTTG
jgi:hypothetical protein